MNTIRRPGTANPPLWFLAACALAGIGVVFWFWYSHQKPAEPPPPPRTFDGPSTALQHTVIVPTLDSPIPPGKSVVWCGSFQLAWNELKRDLAKGDVLLENAQEVADRLNRVEFAATDMKPEDYYAAAGWDRDGIVDRINREMAQKFPDAPRPASPPGDAIAVAYGYLNAGVRFTHPYFDEPDGLQFVDSSKKASTVAAFGLRPRDSDHAYWELRDQAQVLFDSHWGEADKSDPEFAIDPCRFSQPYQIVLARVRPRETLAQTLAEVQRRITATDEELRKQIGPGPKIEVVSVMDTLLVPQMHWRIDHRFPELEGKDKRFLNPSLAGTYLAAAEQVVAFRLDRSGAAVESSATMAVGGGPRHFHFDRPFLIYLKKRDSQQPFFVMWVDNAELLVPHVQATPK